MMKIFSNLKTPLISLLLISNLNAIDVEQIDNKTNTHTNVGGGYSEISNQKINDLINRIKNELKEVDLLELKKEYSDLFLENYNKYEGKILKEINSKIKKSNEISNMVSSDDQKSTLPSLNINTDNMLCQIHNQNYVNKSYKNININLDQSLNKILTLKINQDLKKLNNDELMEVYIYLKNIKK